MMGMMLTEEKIHDIIAETVRIELAPCSVRVNVQERENFDDDDRVFIVTVSIETDSAPDDRKMLGLIRKIRVRLQEANVSRSFPMVSFIAKHEEKKSGLEFA